MQILLALIPLIAYIGIFVYLYNRFPADLSRRLLLQAASIWAIYLALSLELLSIFKWITVVGLLLTWAIPIILFAAWAWRKKNRAERINLPVIHPPGSWWNRLILLLICLVLIATAVVAWITPPQTWDSLTYHLSRVAHWAQDRSISHYATGIDRQTSMPPGAEEQILNFYVLTQSDRLSSFPEWLAMFGSIVGVSIIAYYLGANSSGQWLAAGFAATIPMGIVEASSTINDYVATFWVVCLVVECLAYYRADNTRSLIFASLAGGLALLTKPVAVPFMIPFVLWLAYLVIRRHGIWSALKWAAFALLAIGMINAGYLARNVVTYGSLSNPVDFQNHYNQLHTVPGFIATTLKNIGMHLGLPGLDQVNRFWYLLILKAIVKLGLDINDPRMTALGYFQVVAPNTHEDVTSNPYHAYLIFALFIILFFTVKKYGRRLLLYGLLVGLTFLVFSFIYKWNAFGTRYDLAFFVLFAPVAGVILGSFEKVKIGHVLTLLLFIGALPWLVSIFSRPLVSLPGYTDGQSSILAVPRVDLYFANAPREQAVYTQFTDVIKSRGCANVGVMLKGDDPEYLLWVLMGAPRSQAMLEWIVSGPTSRYSPQEFQPCAIICNGCTLDQSPLRGLEIAQQVSDMWLYLPPGE